MSDYLQCNKCAKHGCRINPIGRCEEREMPTFIKKNTMFENLVHKNEEQAVQVLNLLDKHQISFQRYTS
jgi:hypothetical protein